MFSKVSFSTVPMLTLSVDSFTPKFKMAPETGSSFILARVVVSEGYLSRLLCYSGRQIECHYCYLYHNLSWCHISRWRRKGTTTILNMRSSTCKRNKRYVQNRKYFRFVVAILKDWFAVNSDSIYLASVSSTSPKTNDYILTSLWCEQHLLNGNYFCFLSTIFISGVTATLGNVNIIAIENVIPENIGIRHSSWNFVFVCLRNKITP